MRIAITILLMLASRSALAQNPWEECCTFSFPYVYCLPAPHLACSAPPVKDGAWKAPLPSCVNVGTFPDNAVWQPKGDAPSFADPPVLKDPSSDCLVSDFIGKRDQYNQDLALFNKGKEPEDPGYCGNEADCYEIGRCIQYYLDLDAYNKAKDSYVEVFKNSMSNSDAFTALARWTDGICLGLEKTAGCCINIVPDANKNDFSNDPLNVLAVTVGFNTTVQCLTPCLVTIHVNVTPELLFQSLSNPHADPSYTLHQVPQFTWYTGGSPNAEVSSEFEQTSFLQLMEHEIGHWLGLGHPNQRPFNCSNACDLPTTVMVQGNNQPGQWALPLSFCDQCEFRKLYCPAPCPGDAVEEISKNDFKATLFPNPSNRSVRLQYLLSEIGHVNITLLNSAGEVVQESFSGYEIPGEHMHQLDLAGLPSGQYSCILQVYDRACYLSLVIKH